VSTSRPATEDELSLLLERMKEDEIVQKKIDELDSRSFAEWFQMAFQAVATGLGYAIAEIVNFIKNMAYAFATGFKQGYEAATKKSDEQRKKIENRNFGEGKKRK